MRLSVTRKWLVGLLAFFVMTAAAKELRAAAPEDAVSATEDISHLELAEIQNNILDEHSLLLKFSLFEDASYLRIVGKNETAFYVLPPREQIESRIEKLRELLLAREAIKDESIEDYQKRIAEADKNYRLEARLLSDCLLGQIADKIVEKRLIVIPDGKLHSFPIAALPVPNSNQDEPLLLFNETTYEPSVSFLIQHSKNDNRKSAAKDLLVFTDPVFTAGDERFSAKNKPAVIFNAETAALNAFRRAESLNSLPRLTASKTEGDSITEIVGTRTTDAFSGFPANREQLLKTKTDDYKIIHFATHSYFNENHPELSGIVLSRFDEKGRRLDEVFRLADIYKLNLNADLVVLSACETGLGKRVKGEGEQSLSDAFLQTGAKSVMASLWKVEDTATLELMKNFYDAMINERLTPSQSLRRAQIKLRQNPQYQSPFYWAAFTVGGDFKTVPQISKSLDYKIYGLLIFPFGLIFLTARRFDLFNRKPVNKS